MLKYILNAVELISNAIIARGQKYVKPMFFSSNRPESIIAPYVYVFVGMLLFFASIIMFLYLSYMAATKGIQDSAIILPTLAGVIATLIAMVGIMIKLYNDGKSRGELEELMVDENGDPIINPEK